MKVFFTHLTSVYYICYNVLRLVYPLNSFDQGYHHGRHFTEDASCRFRCAILRRCLNNGSMASIRSLFLHLGKYHLNPTGMGSSGGLHLVHV